MDKDRQGTSCPIARSLALVGDSWSLLILREAGFGRTRFEQFRESLGIAPNILARRLAGLTAAGLLERRRYSERPPRDDYVLTESGRDFLPVLAAIAAWGRRHCGPGAMSHVVDLETGRPVEPIVIDRATGRPIGSFATAVVQPEAEITG